MPLLSLTLSCMSSSSGILYSPPVSSVLFRLSFHPSGVFVKDAYVFRGEQVRQRCPRSAFVITDLSFSFISLLFNTSSAATCQHAPRSRKTVKNYVRDGYQKNKNGAVLHTHTLVYVYVSFHKADKRKNRIFCLSTLHSLQKDPLYSGGKTLKSFSISN